MKQKNFVDTLYGPNRTWLIASILTAIAIASPIVAIIWVAISPDENVWSHLATSVLPTYIFNSVILMMGVGTCVAIIGTGTAWLIAMCKFPGSNFFAWMLILPMAMPAYVVAYVYTDFLEFSGPLQTLLRITFDWRTSQDYWFPEIRSAGGAITVLSLVLYPYVYALTRAAFLIGVICRGRENTRSNSFPEFCIYIHTISKTSDSGRCNVGINGNIE